MSHSQEKHSDQVENGDCKNEEMTPLTQLIWTATTLVQQALTLLNENISSDEQLVFPSKLLPGSTIGKQLRHAHAHFLLLLDAVTSAGSKRGEWVVNYDVRQRNTPMESSFESAKEAMLDLIERLNLLKGAMLKSEDPIVVNAVTPDRQILQSSFGRELWFAAHHAIHHWAMVRVVAAEQNINVDDSFGVAPSTLLYRGSEATLAKAKI